MLWEQGWVEESTSVALAVGSVTALAGSWKVTIGSPTGLCLIPLGREGSLAAKEKGALHRQHCFHSQKPLELPGGKVGGFGQVELVAAGSSSALASTRQWTNNWSRCCGWCGFQGYVCSLSIP